MPTPIDPQLEEIERRRNSANELAKTDPGITPVQTFHAREALLNANQSPTSLLMGVNTGATAGQPFMVFDPRRTSDPGVQYSETPSYKDIRDTSKAYMEGGLRNRDIYASLPPSAGSIYPAPAFVKGPANEGYRIPEEFNIPQELSAQAPVYTGLPWENTYRPGQYDQVAQAQRKAPLTLPDQQPIRQTNQDAIDASDKRLDEKELDDAPYTPGKYSRK
jgi:hypothetical protein